MKKEDEMQNESLSGAMRIFEALSSVDEELLMRSEGHKRVIPFGRYAKVMAACICFAVVGVAAYTGVQMHTADRNMSADCAAPPDMKEATGGAAPEAAGANLVMSEETMSDETWDEEALRATEILGAYIPTWLPEGYVYESGCGIDENHPEQGISLQWTNGEDTISISVRECMPEQELMTEEYPVFAEGEFTLENVKVCMESVSQDGEHDAPRGGFAVLYDSGILVEFHGSGTAESIWEMFESID